MERKNVIRRRPLRRGMLWRATCLLGTFFLTGCAAIGFRADLPPEDREQVHSIGVVSMLGDVFQMNYVGTVIFQNKSIKLQVPDWDVDAHAAAEAVEAIKQLGPYNASVLATGATRLKDALAMASEARLDAVVVIEPALYDNARWLAPGYAFTRQNAWGARFDCFSAMLVASIYSVRSERKLAWEWGFPTTYPLCWKDQRPGEPWTTQLPWPSSAEEITEEQLQRFKADSLASVLHNIRYSLTNIGLR